MKTETTEKLQDRSMASLKICCPHCEESFDFPELFHKKVQNKEKLASNICPKCETRIPDAYIKNRARLFLKQLQVMYYRGNYQCIESDCRNKTRQLLLKGKCNVVGCKGRVRAEVPEEQANDTLRYLQGLVNVEKYKNEIDLHKKPEQRGNTGAVKQEINIPHKDMLDSIKPYIDEFLDHSKYNKVDLPQIFSFMMQQPSVKAN